MLRFGNVVAVLFLTASTASLAYGLDRNAKSDATELTVACTLTRIGVTGDTSINFSPTIHIATMQTASIRTPAEDNRSLNVAVDRSNGQSLVRINGELTDANGNTEFVPTIIMRIGNTATIKVDRADGSSLEIAVAVTDGTIPESN